MEFKPWPKILRVEKRRTPIFTEKIDGTNSCIVCSFSEANEKTIGSVNVDGKILNVWVQSRTRFITPDDDNFGFAKFVSENIDVAAKLGEGYHFGEWWGLGIQRGYNLVEKRFSLFNTRRWGDHNPPPSPFSVVPILPVDSAEEARQFLINNGSVASPGFMRPEGAVMYDVDSDVYFKIIIDK